MLKERVFKDLEETLKDDEAFQKDCYVSFLWD